jgi:hypothetical protein
LQAALPEVERQSAASLFFCFDRSKLAKSLRDEISSIPIIL